MSIGRDGVKTGRDNTGRVERFLELRLGKDGEGINLSAGLGVSLLLCACNREERLACDDTPSLLSLISFSSSTDPTTPCLDLRFSVDAVGEGVSVSIESRSCLSLQLELGPLVLVVFCLRGMLDPTKKLSKVACFVGIGFEASQCHFGRRRTVCSS